MASSGSAPSDVKKDSNPKMNKEEVNKEKDDSASLENEKLKNKDKDASAGLETEEEVSSVKKKRKRDEDAEEASRIQAQEERKKRRLARRRRNADRYEAEAREWNWKQAYEQALRRVAADDAWLDNETARINRLKKLKLIMGHNENLKIEEIQDIKTWDSLNEQRKFRETNPEQNELAIREWACSALKTWQGCDNVFDLVERELEPESESEKDNR
ncbi:protein MNN4-like [Rosa sericea]